MSVQNVSSPPHPTPEEPHSASPGHTQLSLEFPSQFAPGSVVGPRDRAESQHTAPSPARLAGSSAGLREEFGCCSLGHRDGRGFGLRPGSEPQLYHFLALWPRAISLLASLPPSPQTKAIRPTSQSCRSVTGSQEGPAFPPVPSPGLAMREGLTAPSLRGVISRWRLSTSTL